MVYASGILCETSGKMSMRSGRVRTEPETKILKIVADGGSSPVYFKLAAIWSSSRDINELGLFFRSSLR